MKKTVIITIAGCSSRFSKSVGFECHKALYHEKNDSWTILSHHLSLLSQYGFDEIIIVGGYRYAQLEKYVKDNFSNFPLKLCYNSHYVDYGSCYSFVLGINLLASDCDEVVFIEGDLIFDRKQFEAFLQTSGDVITANKFLIDAKTAVAFYISEEGKLGYVYDTAHQKLSIPQPFIKIGNSGQVWKFSDVTKLKNIVLSYSEDDFKQTNLKPIVDYFDDIDCNFIQIISFDAWFNCNTIDDYRLMKKYLGGSRDE